MIKGILQFASFVNQHTGNDADPFLNKNKKQYNMRMVGAAKTSEPPKSEVSMDHSNGQNAGKVAGDAIERIVKTIPISAFVLFHLGTESIISSADDRAGNMFLFVCCLLATMIGRRKLIKLKRPLGRKFWAGVLKFLFIMLVACLWIYSLGGYLVDLGEKDGEYANFLLVFFALVVPAAWVEELHGK